MRHAQAVIALRGLGPFAVLTAVSLVQGASALLVSGPSRRMRRILDCWTALVVLLAKGQLDQHVWDDYSERAVLRRVRELNEDERPCRSKSVRVEKAQRTGRTVGGKESSM
jgi:hypothetical protein